MTVKTSSPSNAAAATLAELRQLSAQRLQTGKLAEAIDFLGRASALAPDDPQLRLQLGVALQGARRHDEALEHFGRAQAAMPEAPLPFLHMAFSLLALGKAEPALLAAQEACSRAPRLPQALCALGQALLALSQPKRAEEAFDAALKSAPDSADVWVLCGAARYRQGDVEGAKAAMRQALHHAPSHAAASSNLAALERVGSGFAASLSEAPKAPKTGGQEGQAAAEPLAFTARKPENAATALGLAVDYLSKKPAFARLQFGEWSRTLFHQAERGHFFFVVDQHQRVQGFVGWALAHEHLAEQWVEGRCGLRSEQCLDGDCIIINAWAADTPAANSFIVKAGREFLIGKRALYFKRHYADGRVRPMRLNVKDFIGGQAGAGGRRCKPLSD